MHIMLDGQIQTDVTRNSHSFCTQMVNSPGGPADAAGTGPKVEEVD